MTQPLYTEQDNQDLNAQVEAKVHARGEQPSINYLDEAAFYKTPADVPATDAPSVKIQQSSTFGTMNQKPSFTEGGITVTTPAAPNFQLSPEQIRVAQAQLQDGGAVVLGQDGSSQMFANIKDMFANKVTASPKKETFFVMKGSMAAFSIDRTIFEPTAIVRLSGKNFEAKYLAQLESYIYNSQDELDPDKLFAIIFLSNLIKDGKFPIKLVTNKHKIQLARITTVFNTFFNKNYSVVMGILTMFSGMQVQQPQAPEKAE